MVLGWYAKHGRRFVWRVPSPDPYVVLVSEIMLQRTQTSRVQQRLPEFLSQFPDFAALAAADNATVIRAWRGMGYNNRALRLRDCARVVVQQFQGSLPDRRTDLGQLPGLGPYTVGAILSFAFHQDTVVLDVNIRRLYSRLFCPRNDCGHDAGACASPCGGTDVPPWQKLRVASGVHGYRRRILYRARPKVPLLPCSRGMLFSLPASGVSCAARRRTIPPGQAQQDLERTHRRDSPRPSTRRISGSASTRRASAR